jgi:ankyrin repeat protein
MSSVEARDRDGRTPLHYAALEDNVKLVADLVVSGADPNAQDKAGYTPLHMAAQAYAVAAAESLVRAGAAVDIQDRHGNTPLWTAVYNSPGTGELIRLLRAAGADPRHRNRYGRTPVDLARSIADYDVAQYFADLE